MHRLHRIDGAVGPADRGRLDGGRLGAATALGEVRLEPVGVGEALDGAALPKTGTCQSDNAVCKRSRDVDNVRAEPVKGDVRAAAVVAELAVEEPARELDVDMSADGLRWKNSEFSVNTGRRRVNGTK
jgi:hypothetical protein